MDLTLSDLHPLTLRRVLDERDPAWVDADPQVLWDFVDTVGPISNENRNKLQAVRTILRQPEVVVDDWRVFNVCVLALNGLTPDMRIVETPSYPELIGGGTIASTLLADMVVPSQLYRYAAAVAMFRSAPELIEPFTPGDRFMLVRGENKGAVAQAIAYNMVLAQRLRDQANVH